VAGVHCSLALRSSGFLGEIVLVDQEDVEPYDKPPLSKDLLAGRAGVDSISLLSPMRAEQEGLTLLRGCTAIGVNVASRTLHLRGRDALSYDNLVIATGSRARTSPWCGNRIFSLRNLDDARAIRSGLIRGRRLVVVGAGFIGAEVAATARELGLGVVVVDPQSTPMARIFNREIGDRFAELNRRHGVEMLLGVHVDQIEHRGDVAHVQLSTGRELIADIVVVGIGSEPNDEWLEGSGLVVDDGVLCDEHGLAHGQTNVHAIGDVSRWVHPRDGNATRLEHWTNATEQAACVAHNIVTPDARRVHHPVEYVWSDQYDWRIQVAGRIAGSSEHVTIEGPNEDQFVVLFTDAEGGLRGGASVNWPRALAYCRKSIAKGGRASVVEELLGVVRSAEPR